MARVETKHYAGDLVGTHQGDGNVLIQMAFDESIVAPLADLIDLVESLRAHAPAVSASERKLGIAPCSVCGTDTSRCCPACRSGGLCGGCGCPHCGRRGEPT